MWLLPSDEEPDVNTEDGNKQKRINGFVNHVLFLLFTTIELSLGGSSPYTSNK